MRDCHLARHAAATAEHREAPLAPGRRPHGGEDFGSRLLWVLTVLTALGLGYVWLSPPVQVANNCPQVRIVPEPRCGIIC